MLEYLVLLSYLKILIYFNYLQIVKHRTQSKEQNFFNVLCSICMANDPFLKTDFENRPPPPLPCMYVLVWDQFNKEN
jgi:hypothetical protein